MRRGFLRFVVRQMLPNRYLTQEEADARHKHKRVRSIGCLNGLALSRRIVVSRYSFPADATQGF
jgi:hypothetical protein